MTFENTIFTIVTLTMDEVYDALFSNEKMNYLVVGSRAQAEGLVVHGMPQEWYSNGDMRANWNLKIETTSVVTVRKMAHQMWLLKVVKYE